MIKTQLKIYLFVVSMFLFSSRREMGIGKLNLMVTKKKNIPAPSSINKAFFYSFFIYLFLLFTQL